MAATDVPLSLISHKLYNSLPLLQEAHSFFTDRRVLQDLRDVVSSNRNFAITLVHRHFNLEEGEILVAKSRPTDATDQIAEPVKIDDSQTIYPTAWLSSGQPFEYGCDKSAELDQALLASFADAVTKLKVPQHNGIPILGLCVVPAPLLELDKVYVEVTELPERRNITSARDIQLIKDGTIQAVSAVWTGGHRMGIYEEGYTICYCNCETIVERVCTSAVFTASVGGSDNLV